MTDLCLKRMLPQDALGCPNRLARVISPASCHAESAVVRFWPLFRPAHHSKSFSLYLMEWLCYNNKNKTNAWKHFLGMVASSAGAELKIVRTKKKGTNKLPLFYLFWFANYFDWFSERFKIGNWRSRYWVKSLNKYPAYGKQAVPIDSVGHLKSISSCWLVRTFILISTDTWSPVSVGVDLYSIGFTRTKSTY